MVLVVAHDRKERDTLSGWVRAAGLSSIEAHDVPSGFGLWTKQRPAAAIIASLESATCSIRLAGQIRVAECDASHTHTHTHTPTPTPTRTVLLSASGYHDATDYERQRKAGFDGVLSKPLSDAALRSRLAACGFAGVLPLSAEAHRASSASTAQAMFWSGLKDDVDDLAASLHRMDREALRRGAHRIKGACLMFGHPELADAAGKLEAHCELQTRGELQAIRDLILQIVVLHRQAVESLGRLD